MGDSCREPRTPRDRRKPFQPAVGRDFGSVEEVEAGTRDFLAKASVLGSGTVIFTAGVYSLATKDFGALTTVWAVIGPVVGAVVTYYFGPRRNNTG